MKHNLKIVLPNWSLSFLINFKIYIQLGYKELSQQLLAFYMVSKKFFQYTLQLKMLCVVARKRKYSVQRGNSIYGVKMGKKIII